MRSALRRTLSPARKFALGAPAYVGFAATIVLAVLGLRIWGDLSAGRALAALFGAIAIALLSARLVVYRAIFFVGVIHAVVLFGLLLLTPFYVDIGKDSAPRSVPPAATDTSTTVDPAVTTTPPATTTASSTTAAPTSTTVAAEQSGGDGATVGLAWSLRAALWLLGLFVAAQTFGLLVLSRRWRAEAAGIKARTAQQVSMLPHQEVVRAQLERAVLDGDRAGSAGRLVQVIGDWGDGKTFLIRHVMDRLELKKAEGQGRGRVAVAWIDVWENVGDRDVHSAIVTEVLSHPAHSRWLRWLGYPPVVFARVRLKGFGAKAATASIEVEYMPPDLPFHNGLKRVLARSKTLTVIVLDEVDRASPQVTQIALTLSRRSLDLPNVCVIFPFVEQSLLEKAFSPWYAQLDDIESFLWIETAAARSSETIRGRIMESAWQPEGSSTTEGHSKVGEGPVDDARARRRAVLYAVYNEMSPADQLWHKRRAARKLMTSRPITMGDARGKAIPTILLDFPVVRSSLDGLATSLTGHPMGNSLTGLLTGALGTTMANPTIDLWERKLDTPLRDLQAELVRAFNAVEMSVVEDLLPAWGSRQPPPGPAAMEAVFVKTVVTCVIDLLSE